MTEEETKKAPDATVQPEQSDDQPAVPGPTVPEILSQALARLECMQAGLRVSANADRLEVEVTPATLIATALEARDGLGYRLLMSITAVDWSTSFELVYHLYHLESPYPVVLRCKLPREQEPEVPSLVPVWPGAEFQEREVYDLMGIAFAGHPDLRRILLADDFDGYPLRKDFKQDPHYVLVPHLRLPGYEGAKRGSTSTGHFLDEDEGGA